MAKLPAMQWYTGDWKKDPELSMCSPATRGIWADILCAMHEADRCGKITGTITQLARIARCSIEEMRAAAVELDETKAADVTFCHENVTLINRRMASEYKERKSALARKKCQRGQPPGQDDTTDVTQKSRSPSSSSISSSSSDNPLKPPLVMDSQVPMIGLPDGLNLEPFQGAWGEWIRYLAGRGRVSQQALVKQLVKLETYGVVKAAQLLDEAITKNWAAPVWPEERLGASKARVGHGQQHDPNAELKWR